jgi:Tol biopolymer transport system component
VIFRSGSGGIRGTAAALGAIGIGMGMLAHRPASAGAKDGPAGELIVRAAELSNPDGGEPFTGLAAVDPETGRWRPVLKGSAVGPGHVSPDGRFLVYSSLGENTPPESTGIWVHDLTGQGPPRRIFEQKGEPFWVDGGRRVVIGTWTARDWGRFGAWRVNADGSGRERLPIPEGDLILHCSDDGTWIATRTLGGEPQDRGRLTLVHPDGTGARVLTEGSANDDLFTIFRIAPDNRRVAYVEIRTVDKVRHATLFVVDVDGQHRRRIPTHFEPGTTVTLCWSPDGSRLALSVINPQRRNSVVLVNTDGPNYHFRTLPQPPGESNIQVCDWRALASRLEVGAADGKGR